MSSSTERQKAYAPASDGESQSSPANGNQPIPGNVDKIRDILFGGQMRDYDKKFSRLEERLAKESAELRAETKRLFDSLENFVKKELEALAERLQSEQQSREASVQSVSGELRETGKALEVKIQQSVERAARAESDLRQQILDQSKSLVEEMRQKHEELSGSVDRDLAELNHQKTDRASLAAMFSEFSMRLNNDFKIPSDS
jgi:type VI protein secretion system component VasK